MKGWWIFAGTAAVAILSKHLIRIRGHHFLNPSNFGLVLCFVLLGPTRADPLAFWWGPMSPWMALALAIILVGAFAILTRLHLLAIAVSFWLVFAAGIAVIAAAGHEMTARWHLGPITGFEFWKVLVFSPEVLIFLFFMITDPKTIPRGRFGRRVYAVSVALLAVLLIAPQSTEFWTKVALLAALTLVCAARPVVEALAPRARARGLASEAARARCGRPRRRASRSPACSCSRACRRGPVPPPRARRPRPSSSLPPVTVLASKGVATQIDPKLAQVIAADLVADLRIEADALRRRDKTRAAGAAGGERLQGLWEQISSAGKRAIIVPERRVDRLQLNLEAAVGQAPPLAIATVTGTERLVTYRGHSGDGGVPRQRDAVQPHPRAPARPRPLPHRRLAWRHPRGGRSRLVGAARLVRSRRHAACRTSRRSVGLDFQQSAFRSRATVDTTAMMGGGVCWVDIDNDGWLDLFAVNSYADRDLGYWLRARRHAPQRALPQRQRAASRTSAARRGPTSRSAATAASPATSTATASPTST